MTASWGGVGVLWGKKCCHNLHSPAALHKRVRGCTRCVYNYIFGENCREALALCGKVSGRDGDKIKEAGLTPYFVDGTTAFEEAEMIFVCRKLYADEIKPEKFIATENDARWYPEKDYHTMYIAEITKVLVKEA